MEIRAARSAEYDAVLALAVACYAGGGFTTPEARLRGRLRTLMRSAAGRVAVAADAGGLHGFAITTTGFGLENGLIAELEDLYVAPPSRRRGVAGRLIEDSARWAREYGCAQLELVVVSRGRDASSLLNYYDRRGFRDSGRLLLARRLSGG
ncbi:GNAT family N-acetyltransferase [Amycolatopsis orientalis]|uniref:GNAT family N-acetyltransferase n=1 Tax=Amycolatopsis orientalis TaxID=31958 RepID=UPI0003A3046F|nr:GNAT family N-acetyltransferase [Amycolatopsis orientalis]